MGDDGERMTDLAQSILLVFANGALYPTQRACPPNAPSIELVEFSPLGGPPARDESAPAPWPVRRVFWRVGDAGPYQVYAER